jgi:Phospholipase_D-nuclease N-terminal
MARKKTWAELSSTQKRAVVVAGAVEVAMTVAAWRDLATRPASTVRGPKPAWALAVLVQPVGPLAYFALGRR